MFRFTENPSSGSLVQCLAKITRMILSCPLIWTRSVHCVWRHPSYTVNYTHAQRVTICCHNTDFVHVNGHDRIILVIFSQVLYKAPWWCILCDPKHIGGLLKYFIILVVSTYYILCISWIIKCLISYPHFTCVYLAVMLTGMPWAHTVE